MVYYSVYHILINYLTGTVTREQTERNYLFRGLTKAWNPNGFTLNAPL